MSVKSLESVESLKPVELLESVESIDSIAPNFECQSELADYNSRIEPRLEMVVPLRLRFPRSEPLWHEDVVSENVSRHGVCINTATRIPIQTRVYIETMDRCFSAIAVVVHSTPWQAGLQIIASKGDWVVD